MAFWKWGQGTIGLRILKALLKPQIVFFNISINLESQITITATTYGFTYINNNNHNNSAEHVAAKMNSKQ